ncbi:hypothetical protein B0H14DRAFT_2909575, partial [Mycena olivaceomarginata]
MWDRGGGDRAFFGLHEQAESLLRREALPRLRDSRDMSEGATACGAGSRSGRMVRLWEGVLEDCRNGRMWLEDWHRGTWRGGACGWRASHCRRRRSQH